MLKQRLSRQLSGTTAPQLVRFGSGSGALASNLGRLAVSISRLCRSPWLEMSKWAIQVPVSWGSAQKVAAAASERDEAKQQVL